MYKKSWFALLLCLGVLGGGIIGLLVGRSWPIESGAPPVVHRFYLTDLEGNPLPEEAGWTMLQSKVLLHVEYDPDAVDRIEIYSLPTGTETWSMQEWIAASGSSIADRSSSPGHMQSPWEVPHGFMGHLYLRAYQGHFSGQYQELDSINAIRAD